MSWRHKLIQLILVVYVDKKYFDVYLCGTCFDYLVAYGMPVLNEHLTKIIIDLHCFNTANCYGLTLVNYFLLLTLLKGNVRNFQKLK